MLSVGIVGLPNVGKSTLFNVLLKKRQALAANYPFATIEPNIGIVEIPDERLELLTEVSKSKQTVPTAIKFVDIAGIVSGASKGEGLGNQFLSHIRECDALILVLRFFKDSDVTHVSGHIDPKEDFETLKTELILADLTTLQKLVHNNDIELKKGSKQALIQEKVLSAIYSPLSKGKLASMEQFEDEEQKAIASKLPLITLKPMIIAANLDEDDLGRSYNEIADSAEFENLTVIPFCARLEEELLDLDAKEARHYLSELNVKQSGLDRLVTNTYQLLNLITFFTSGPQETRAWTVENGATAPKAAAKIHNDFEKGFIAAEIAPYDLFVKHGGWQGAKQHGAVRTEGKTYQVLDGDVCFFKFNL